MAAITAFQLTIWYSLVQAGLAPKAEFSASGRLLYLVFCAALGLAYYLWVLFKMARANEPRPLEKSIALIWSSSPRILIVIAAVYIIGLQSFSFTALKSGIPAVNPFWLDPYLASVERYVLGAHPYQITHVLFGWATPFIDAVYATWIPVQMISFFTLLTIKPSTWKAQAIVTFVAAWTVLGFVGATLMASVGPVYYDRIFGGDLFSGLDLTDAPIARASVETLWNAYLADATRWGSGISAMPSMHVGLAGWLVLVFRGTKMAPVAWAYFALIWLGSVHLGWHYLSDGLVGALGVYAIWKATGRTLRPTTVDP